MTISPTTFAPGQASGRNRPATLAHPGRLPEFWDRRAIFLANIHSIFFGNVEGTETLESEVKGIEAYGCRLVPLVDLIFPARGNLLIVEAAPQPSLLNFFRDDLGLSIPDIEVARLSFFDDFKKGGWPSLEMEFTKLLRRVSNHPADVMDGFVTDDGLEDFAALAGKGTLSSVAGSRRGNNKYLLHAHLEKLGLPVFETNLAEHPADVAAAARPLFDAGYKAVVAKAQLGASGIGIMKLGRDCLKPGAGLVPEYLFHEGPCMIQGWLDESVEGVKRVGSPSVQLFLTDSAVALYDVTEQLLSDASVHQGNISPPEYLEDDKETLDEMLRQAAAAGEWLHDQGYRGPGSVDFLLVERGGVRQPTVCEINARVTGATYPSVLARHFLPHGAWLMCNILFEPSLPATDLFERLRGAGLLFREGASRGVIPINFVPGADGLVPKGQFLCIGATRDECIALLEGVEGVLPASWRFERD